MLEAASVAANADATMLEQAAAQAFLDLAHDEARQSARLLRALLELQTLIKSGPVSDRMSRSPAAMGLRAEIARLSTSTPTLLVTTAMALSIAEVPGKLDEALAQLEELLVGAEDG